MRLYQAIFATWSPAETRRVGGWTLRRGEDSIGLRVTSATRDDPEADIAEADAAMRAWGQTPVFMIRPGDEALDRALAERGYARKAPTLILAAPAERVASEDPDERTILGPEPIAAMREIWADGGVGPPHLAIMARTRGPKTYLLGRCGDSPAGSAFVACDREVAMLQALQVLPAFRRQGLGSALARAAAAWALRQDASVYCLAVEVANAPARAAYAGIGMEEVSAYHFRIGAAG